MTELFLKSSSGVERPDSSETTLVFDRAPLGKVISCAAVFASGALLFSYLSKEPSELRFLPILGLTALLAGTILAALVQYGDRIYLGPHGMMSRNKFLGAFGKADMWISWKEVVEITEVRRKILILFDEQGTRFIVDAIAGYPLARREILRRSPHAVISGTLDRSDRP